MEIYGVGPSLGPQLMAEIGDVRRFSSNKSLIAFAEIEPQPNDSGKVAGNDKEISKVGSAVLRRTLFLIMSVILQTPPQLGTSWNGIWLACHFRSQIYCNRPLICEIYVIE